MRRLLPVVCVALCLFFLTACGGPVGYIKTEDYTISYWKGWTAVKFDKPGQDNVEAAIYPEKGPTHVGIKIAVSVRPDIKWGHIREVTPDYGTNSEKMLSGYTLVNKEYIATEQAYGDEKLVAVFNTVQSGQAYTIVQNLYAVQAKVLYITGTYPEGDEAMKADIQKMLDDFKLAPKGN